MTQGKQTEINKVQHINPPAKTITETTGELPLTLAKAHYFVSSAPPPAIKPKHIVALQRVVGNRSVQKVLQRYHPSMPQTGSIAADGMVQRHPDDTASQWRTSALQQHETKLSQHDESLSQNAEVIEANKQEITLNGTTDRAVQDTTFNWVGEIEGRAQQSEMNIQQLANKLDALQSAGGGIVPVPATGGF